MRVTYMVDFVLFFEVFRGYLVQWIRHSLSCGDQGEKNGDEVEAVLLHPPSPSTCPVLQHVPQHFSILTNTSVSSPVLLRVCRVRKTLFLLANVEMWGGEERRVLLRKKFDF